ETAGTSGLVGQSGNHLAAGNDCGCAMDQIAIVARIIAQHVAVWPDLRGGASLLLGEWPAGDVWFAASEPGGCSIRLCIIARDCSLRRDRIHDRTPRVSPPSRQAADQLTNHRDRNLAAAGIRRATPRRFRADAAALSNRNASRYQRESFQRTRADCQPRG